MTASENRKILFIINPASGSNRKTNIQKALTHMSQNHSLSPFFLETTGNNDQLNISKAIESTNPNVVVAVGGDGTVNMAAPLLTDTKIKLGIIPTGSANGMAFELNIPTNLEQAVNIIARDVSTPVDLLKINNRQIAVHLSDIGMNARIIKRFDEEKIRGLYGYARQFFKELKSPSHFHCIIECSPKRKRKYKAVMVVMLNTHFYGTGAVINPTGKLNDGKFEIVVIKPYPWYYIFHMFLAFFTGNTHRLRHVKLISCKKARIKLRPAQELQVDGEPAGRFRNVDIEVLPSAIEVLYNDRQEHFFLKTQKKGD